MRNPVLCAVLVGFSLSLVYAQDQEGLSERGVRLSEQPGGLTYDIELIRGVERGIVSTAYRFQNGDRFAVRLRLTRDAYVYVLNRTFTGDPDDLRATRAIRLVPNTPSPGGPSAPQPPAPGTAAHDTGGSPFAVIYPPTGHRLLKAGPVNLLPSAEMALEMDEHPGLEHVVLIVSPAPLSRSWLLQRAAAVRQGSPPRSTDEDIDTQLRELQRMAANAEVEESVVSSREIILVAKPGEPKGSPFSGAETKPHIDSAPANPNGAGPSPATAGRPLAPARPFVVDFILSHHGA